jgi:eukaryotic-like serine/threonine-protein kinase
LKPGRERSPWLVWQSREQRLLRQVVLVAVGAFLLGYAASALWMWAGSSSRSVVTVPNLRDLSLEEATRLAERSELAMEPADSLAHPEVAAGHVLTQSPLPGQEVAPGTAVQVILSAGRERHAVPQVKGLSREQAEELLVASGMQPVVEEVTDRSRAGFAVGTNPPAGTVLEIPAPVRMQVSLGPPLVAVPDLLGLNEADVAGQLTLADLRLGEVQHELRIFELEGQVVAQQPAAGDSIPAGSPVDVVVATQRLDLPPLDFRRR